MISAWRVVGSLRRDLMKMSMAGGGGLVSEM